MENIFCTCLDHILNILKLHWIFNISINTQKLFLVSLGQKNLFESLVLRAAPEPKNSAFFFFLFLKITKYHAEEIWTTARPFSHHKNTWQPWSSQISRDNIKTWKNYLCPEWFRRGQQKEIPVFLFSCFWGPHKPVTECCDLFSTRYLPLVLLLPPPVFWA